MSFERSSFSFPTWIRTIMYRHWLWIALVPLQDIDNILYQYFENHPQVPRKPLSPFTFRCNVQLTLLHRFRPSCDFSQLHIISNLIAIYSDDCVTHTMETNFSNMRNGPFKEEMEEDSLTGSGSGSRATTTSRFSFWRPSKQEVYIPTAVAIKEERRVSISKAMMIIILVFVAAGFCAATFLFLREDEKQLFGQKVRQLYLLFNRESPTQFTLLWPPAYSSKAILLR